MNFKKKLKIFIKMPTQTQNLDIVSLIEENPIINLNKIYQNKLINKIKNKFSTNEQQIFVLSHYGYLHYTKDDYPVDLDDIWKGMGFSEKSKAKRTLAKNFAEPEDYKILQIINKISEEKSIKKNLGGSGLNKEQILMKVDTFKAFCLIVKTDKGKQIRNYYLKLEETLHEVIDEESNELRLQIEQQKIQLIEQKTLLIEHKEMSEKEKQQVLQQTLINQFPVNTLCVYFGVTDNVDEKGQTLLKFGISNNFNERLTAHLKTYTNFRIINVFRVKNHIEIENCIKKHPILKKQRRNKIINNVNYTELLAINDKITIPVVEDYIKEIITENEYNIENYTKLLEKCDELENHLIKTKKENTELTKQNEKLTLELSNFKPIKAKDSYKFETNSRTETKHGYKLYIFEFKKLRYKCGMCKNITLETLEKSYKSVNKDCKMVYTLDIKHPFLEKVMLYLLKENLLFLGDQTFEGEYSIIKIIMDKILELENLLVNNSKTVEKLLLQNVNEENVENPEIPIKRKAKRPIDQINKETGKIIASFPSIEAAGKAIGCTGSAVGIGLRNKTLCKGFLFRYSGVSQEDQMSDQPVIKINCNTGEKINFSNIASAAKDAGLSAPGLRNRILTDVHVNNFHWVFNKTATHYTHDS